MIETVADFRLFACQHVGREAAPVKDSMTKTAISQK